MAAIYLAGNRIVPIVGGIEFPTAFGHLQLVYQGQELEVQAPTDQLNPFLGEWGFQRERDHQANTPHYGEAGYYASIAIDIGSRDEADTWNILKQVNDQYVDSGKIIGYDIPFNSNSYANTLLSVIGIDASSYLLGATPFSPVGSLPVIGFPGAGANALLELESFIDLNLNGGDGSDTIITGRGSDNLMGGGGDDLLSGGGGDDILNGGAGYDTVDYSNDSDGRVAGIQVTWNPSNGDGTVLDGQYTAPTGSTDTLISIERIIGTDFSDTFKIVGDLSGQSVLFEGGSENSAEGDVLDLSGAAPNSAGSIFISTSTGPNAATLGSVGGLIDFANIETIIGTSGADVFTLGGTSTTIAEHLVKLDAGTSPTGVGDTLDFSGLTGSSAVYVDLASDIAGDFDGGILGATFAVMGFENVIGTSNNDIITGNDADNLINGGGGADTIDGGAGFDTLIFDPTHGAVTVDLAAGTPDRMAA